MGAYEIILGVTLVATVCLVIVDMIRAHNRLMVEDYIEEEVDRRVEELAEQMTYRVHVKCITHLETVESDAK